MAKSWVLTHMFYLEAQILFLVDHVDKEICGRRINLFSSVILLFQELHMFSAIGYLSSEPCSNYFLMSLY